MTDVPTHFSAKNRVQAWRQDLNCFEPQILGGAIFYKDRVETLPVGKGSEAPRSNAIWIDFAKAGHPISAANLAAALGQAGVIAAAERLVEVAAGHGEHEVRGACSYIVSAVSAQAAQYPLDRPDVRRPHERLPP